MEELRGRAGISKDLRNRGVDVLRRGAQKQYHKGGYMSELIRASELVELAILVERNGEEFYTSVKESAQNENARQVFAFLAGEESKHIDVFRNLLKPLRRYEPAEAYPGEYEGYMKAVADSHVFIKEDAGKDLAQRSATALEAVDMAVRFEKDTILFFQALGQFIPAAERKTVDHLTDEERKHILRLRELREMLQEE